MALPLPKEAAQLDLNENPQTVSSTVQKAIRQAATKLNRYPGGTSNLETKIAHYLGHGLGPANIIVGAGGSEILHRVAATLVASGDEAIIPIPAFPVYQSSIELSGGTPILIEHQDNYQVDIDEILAHVNARTRIVYVCSPHNPTGTFCSQSQLDQLIAKLPPSVMLLFDEVYWHFGSHPDRARPWRHLRKYPNLLVLHSFSKAFGLAGLRLGYGIAQSKVIARLKALSYPFNLNRLTLAAGEEALKDQAFVARSVSLIQEQRTVLYEGLLQLSSIEEVIPSEASFVAFKPRLPGAWLVAQLAASNILVRELSGFTMPGWVRVSVGSPEDNLRFLTAMRDILEH